MEDFIIIDYFRNKGINASIKDPEFLDTLKSILEEKHNKIEYDKSKEWDSPENKEYMDSYNRQNENHFDESYADYIVSNMYHYENGVKIEGKKFCMDTARETKLKYENKISSSVTCADIYVAINAQYHDYIELFKSWFSCDVNQKIIDAAMTFWFMDSDYKKGSKVWNYFNNK